jgi:SAM-dependent methyltransferase
MFFKRFIKKKKTTEMLKDDFYNNLIRLNYVKDKDEIDKIIVINKKIADKIPELNGWPSNPIKFWDIESIGWNNKITEKIRTGIKKELKELKGLNLDLGSGSYAYVKNSVFLDLSLQMLKEIKQKNKIQFKINKTLPFKFNSFDSVTMVFLLNYLENPKLIFKEVKRILKKHGKLIIVQPKYSTDDFYKFQEKHHYSLDEIKKYLKGFKINSYEKKIDNKEIILIKNTKK